MILQMFNSQNNMYYFKREYKFKFNMQIINCELLKNFKQRLKK